MNYPRVVEAFYNTPWAILPEKLADIQAFIERKVIEPPLTHSEQMILDCMDRARAGMPPLSAGPRNGVMMHGRTAVLPVMGTISRRASMLSDASGGTSADAIQRNLESLVADSGVRNIVMCFDSPGGSVAGMTELADCIRMMGQQKKIVGVADSMAASAAYWLMSQCRECYATPSGMVGSIGVIAAHTDTSKMEEAAGVKTTIISAGKYKAEREGPLTDDAKAHLQSLIDAAYGQFVGDVAKGRGVSEATVRSDYGQGRMMTAKDAKAAGLVDGVATLATVVSRMNGGTMAMAAVSKYDIAARIAEIETQG